MVLSSKNAEAFPPHKTTAWHNLSVAEEHVGEGHFSFLYILQEFPHVL